MSTSDNVEYWNDPAMAADLRAETAGASDFAQEVEAQFPRDSHVLDLGCGTGDDAAHFAANGHRVTACDVSAPLIDLASQRFADIGNLNFHLVDMSKALPVAGHSCDATYARLSLHYFDDETTARLFSEIAWALRPRGQLHFLCKSVDDPLYGKGVEIAPDMFELNGYVRHFFSTEYTLDLLGRTGFSVTDISAGTARFYGEPSAYIRCSATKA